MALKIHLEVSLSTTSTHNSGWNRLESKDLSITLAQGFLLYTRSNMEPYDKVDSGKCSSWLLLFKAKENLAGVMMMPNQRGIIQPRPLTLSSASPAILPHYVPGISESVLQQFTGRSLLFKHLSCWNLEIQLHWQALHLPGWHSNLLPVVSFEK